MKIPPIDQIRRMIVEKREATLRLAMDKVTLKIYYMVRDGVDEITMSDLYLAVKELQDPAVAYQIQDELKLAGYLKNNDGVV